MWIRKAGFYVQVVLHKKHYGQQLTISWLSSHQQFSWLIKSQDDVLKLLPFVPLYSLLLHKAKKQQIFTTERLKLGYYCHLKYESIIKIQQLQIHFLSISWSTSSFIFKKHCRQPNLIWSKANKTESVRYTFTVATNKTSKCSELNFFNSL